MEILLEKLIVIKCYRFVLLFSDSTVITADNFCFEVPLNNQSIYPSIGIVFWEISLSIVLKIINLLLLVHVIGIMFGNVGTFVVQTLPS